MSFHARALCASILAGPVLGGSLSGSGPLSPDARTDEASAPTEAAVPADETAREAYVRGWMLEHAEGDPTAALRAYQACLERAGDDPELAARARLRQARIALAQGEARVAESLLEAVIEALPASALAHEARELMAGDRLSSAENPTVQDAVDRARELLTSVLQQRIEVQPGQLAQILRVLPADEIHATCDALQADFPWWPHRSGLFGVRAQLLELVLRSRPERVGFVLELYQGVEELPDEVATLAQDPERRHDRALFHFLVGRADAASARLLGTLVERDPRLGAPPPEGEGYSSSLIQSLVGNPRPIGATLLRRHLEGAVGNDQRISRLLSAWRASDGNSNAESRLLCSETPAGDVLRETYRKLPASTRHELALQLRQARGLPTPPALDVLLTDPEPRIRALALNRLIQYGRIGEVPADALEGLDREARRELIHQACGLAETPAPLPDVLALCADDVDLEGAYSQAIESCIQNYATAEPTRRAARILERGLQQHPAPLFRAALLPAQAGSPPSRDRLTRALTLQSADPVVVALVHRFVEAAARSPEEPVRQQLVEFVASLPLEMSPPGYADLALRDESPMVRLRYLSRRGLSGASDAVQRELLRSPSGEIQQRSIELCQDEEILAEAAAEFSDDRLHVLWEKARRSTMTEVQIACFQATDAPGERFRRFGELALVEFPVLLAGLDDRDETIVLDAERRLAQLARDRSFDGQAFHELDTDARAALVREHRETFHQLFLDDRIAHLVAEVRRGQARQDLSILFSLAELLVERGDRERILELGLERHDDLRSVGAIGLARLGDEEALRTAARNSTEPKELIGPMLDLGMIDEAAELVRQGRHPAHRLVSTLGNRGDGEALARLVELALEDRFDATALAAQFQNTSAADLGVRVLVQHDLSDEKLSALLRRVHSSAALGALIERASWARVLADVRGWNRHSRQAAVEALRERTGLPEVVDSSQPWPRFEEQERALIAGWREALGLR